MASNADLQFQIIVNGVQQNITNIKQLEQAVKDLTKEWKLQEIGTATQIDAYKRLGQAQIALANQLRPVATGLNQTTSASANAGMALLNLNYVVRDSPYFFSNFAMGVLAVGNNLNPLIDSFARLRKEAGEKMVSTFSLLKQAMIGGAGISIAFSVLVTVIQAVVFQMSKNKTASESLADSLKKLWDETYKATKQWDEFTKALGDMSLLDLEESLKGLNKEIKEHNIGLDEWLYNINSITSALVLNLSVGLDIAIEKMAEYIRKRDEIAGAIKGKGVVGWLGLLEAEKKQLEEERKLLPTGTGQNIYDYYNNSIKETQDLIDKLTGKIKKEREEREKITGEIHKQAKAMQVLMNIARGAYFLGGDIRNLRGEGVQPSKNLPIASMFEGASGKRMKDTMKEFNMALETGKIFANQLGDALAAAFNQGTITLKKFIEALMVAIAQMLILRAITAFLTGGASLAGIASPIAPAVIPKGSFGKNVIRVIGKITADKNNFIANIRNADNYYSRNEEFLVIGR